MHRIVTLGTGTGQRKLLQGLDTKRHHLTAIVGVTDNGGSSGAIRKSMEIPQPGDSRNCLTALAPDSILKKLFEFRFKEGDLQGICLGNYLLAALTRVEGEFGLAVEKAAELLQISGRILPVSSKSTHVCVELVTGWKITGEWEIIRRNPRARILRVFLEEPAPLYAPCRTAIQEADLVVIGPGSLMTGIIPVILTTELRNVIKDSSAPVVYVCNIMTQPGQTDGFSVRDHVLEIEKYLDFNLDHVLINQSRIPPELLSHFAAIGAEPVEDNLGADVRAIRADLLQRDSLETLSLHDRPDNVFYLYHDPVVLGKTVMDLLD